MEIEEKLNKALVKRQSNKELLDKRLKRKQELIDELETVKKSQVLVQTIASEVQSNLEVKISSIVNLGLSVLFPEYTFRLEYVPARGKTEVRFVFFEGEDEVDIMEQNGGGLVDAAAFLLRLAVYAISSCDNTMIFDEPFKYVSKTLRPRVAELLKTLSEKLKLQIVYVTHIEELSDTADKKIMIKKIDGVSRLC
jgi:DNA repair exonuclease SbcCD ATPase subunit